MSTDLIDQMLHAWRLNCVHFAVAALVAYDYVLTFSDEVRLIWPAKWSVGKVLFFLTRYPILLETIMMFLETLKFHGKLYHARVWLSFTGIVVAEIIMAVRVHAIWGAKRRVLVFLVIVALSIFAFAVFQLEERVRSPDHSNGIFQPYVDYVLIMAFEFIIAAMTLWKWFSEWRQCESSFAKTIFKDSLRYFVCLLAISSANVLAITTVGSILADSLYVIQRAFHSILSARILLNTHKFAHPENNQEISDVSFAGNSKNCAAGSSLSRIELVEQRNNDTHESRTRTEGSCTHPMKGGNAGPQPAGEIIEDKELNPVIYGAESMDKQV